MKKHSSPVHIAVDLMGSDGDPLDLFFGAIAAAEKIPEGIALTVLATPKVASLLESEIKRRDFVDLCVSNEEIFMDDAPMHAIRRKKESSIVLGLKLLRDQKVDAFVSAGNTGALMLGAYHYLTPMPGIRRPGLLAVLPTEKEPMAVIDVGSNLNCDVEQLLQFAALGAIYQRCALGLSKPRVGILNVGTESKKGTEVQQETYRRLSEMKTDDFVFIGNVEGRDAYQGNVDVLVTDGLVGNVFLKTSEGVSLFIRNTLKKTFVSRDSKLLAEIFSHLQRHFDYSEYPGAILLGVQGIVVKCHGDATKATMEHGVFGTVHLVQQGLLTQIKKWHGQENSA